MARFTANEVKVKAKLSNGEIHEVTTSIEATGDYRSWYEPAPVEWMYGWTECEYEVDDKTIEPTYPNEFMFVDDEKQDDFENNFEKYKDIKVVEIIEVLENVDWEVDDNSIGYDED